MAAMGATVVVLALAASPVSEILPNELVYDVQKAWDAAYSSDSIAAAREAALLYTRIWLAHYFRGDFIDESPFDQDLIVSRGLYILAEDTRVFYLPTESATTNPVVCVSINHAFNQSHDLEDLREEEFNDLIMGRCICRNCPDTTRFS